MFFVSWVCQLERFEIKDYIDNLERLIIFALLNYIHKFIGNLHTMDSRLQTLILVSRCKIHKILKFSWLFVVGC